MVCFQRVASGSNPVDLRLEISCISSAMVASIWGRTRRFTPRLVRAPGRPIHLRAFWKLKEVLMALRIT